MGVSRLKSFFLLGISFLFAFTFCSPSPEIVEVKVKLTDSKKCWIYLCRWDGDQNVVVDSALTGRKGNATLRFITPTPEVLSVSVDKKEFPIALVVSPGERISLQGTLCNYTLTGSRESALIKRAQDYFNAYNANYHSLLMQMPDSLNTPATDSVAKVITGKIDTLNRQMHDFGMSHVISNYFSLTSILVLTAQNSNNGTDLFPYKNFRELYIKTDSCLNSAYPEKTIVKSFRKYIYSKEQLYSIERTAVDYKVGDVIPPVTFSLIDGRTINVPGLWAKLILVDFWAGWCNQCKHQPYSYKKINGDFAKKGLCIVQVAADFNADSLLAISQRDSLGWMHVADTDPYNSRLFKTFGVVKLPSNFLVDRWGRVIAVNIYGDSLVSKLHSILDVAVVKPKPAVDPLAVKPHIQ